MSKYYPITEATMAVFFECRTCMKPHAVDYPLPEDHIVICSICGDRNKLHIEDNKDYIEYWRARYVALNTLHQEALNELENFKKC